MSRTYSCNSSCQIIKLESLIYDIIVLKASNELSLQPLFQSLESIYLSCVQNSATDLSFLSFTILYLVVQTSSNCLLLITLQHVLEHGKPHERSAIIKKLTGQIVQMSQQKFASNVIEKCLTFGTPVDRQNLVNEMLGSTDENEPLQVFHSPYAPIVD